MRKEQVDMIKTILILGATFSIGRIAFYYVSLKLKEKVKGKKRNYAEDIINKQFIPTMLDEEEKEVYSKYHIPYF